MTSQMPACMTALLVLALVTAATPLPTPGPSHVLRSRLVEVPAAEVPLRAPEGFVVHLFAGGLTTPREMTQLPSGEVLVGESGFDLKTTDEHRAPPTTPPTNADLPKSPSTWSTRR